MYTTQLQAGQGLVDETRTLLQLWESGMTTQQLYQLALSSGHFPNITARRLRNIVAECFAPRYLVDSAMPASTLQMLQDHVSLPELKLLFLFYTCRANEILADFVREVYWQRYAGGYSEVTKDDAERFVRRGLDQGKMVKRWADSTIRRVSAYILGCCGDYGLLSSACAGKRQMQPIHITPMVVGCVAYELHTRGVSDTALPSREEWSWIGLDEHEVLGRFKELSSRGWIILQSAAGLTQISWKFRSMEEFCDAIAHG